jgi:site-specific recombinase XerD
MVTPKVNSSPLTFIKEKIEEKKGDFIAYLHENNLSSATIRAYSSDLKQFLIFLKDYSKSWTHLFYHYLNYLKRKRFYSNSTLRRKLTALRTLFLYLGYYLDIPSINTLLLQLPRIKKEDKLPSLLTLEEIEKLIDLCKKKSKKTTLRDLAIIELIFATGIRVGELVKLNLKDLNLEEGTLLVSGKGGKERLLPLSECAKEALHNYLVSRKDNKEALFLSTQGQRISASAIRARFKKYAQELHLEVTPHVLRHSFATILLQRGCDLRLLQEFLGHKSIDATQIYTHLSLIKLREIYNKAFPRP